MSRSPACRARSEKMVVPASSSCIRLIPAAVILLIVGSVNAFGTCPQGPQTFEEATIFNVQCNDTDVVVWTAAEQVKLSTLAVFNKSLTVYGYTITLDDVQLVGTNLTIVAPFIDCGGAKVVTLNTTGKAAPVSYAPNVTEPITCTGNGCQGPPGNSTTIGGGQGGSVTIYASETRNCNSTLIKVITVGGLGGRGEDGGNGVIGETGGDGRTIDCEGDCDHNGYISYQCVRDYPLLDYKGPQYDEEGRQMYCAAYYDPTTKTGEGQGSPGKKGGLPGIAGNSTYSGSGGLVMLPSGSLVTTNFSADSSPGTPISTLANNGRPGAGGIGGNGGLGEQSYYHSYWHTPRCATYGSFNNACRCPQGPTGPPGCEDSTNSTDSCSIAVAQPQVVGDPPVAGKIAYTKDLASQLVLPQINMIVTVASRYYFNRQYEDAARAYLFLTNACNTTANLVRFPSCETLVNQSSNKISQMAKGFDFYGDSITFTPLIGLTALETYAGTQLANFKELEAAYSTYWKASTSATDKKAELQNTISKNTQNVDSLRKKQADVLVQQQASLAEFNVLASQRSTANNTLGRASEAFKKAVNDVRNSQPSFLDLLGCIASTVVNVGADVAGVGKIVGDLDKVILPKDYPKTNKAASGFAGSAFVIGSVENGLYPTWDKYARTAPGADEDATKLVTGSKEFNDYLETYKQLPEAGEYKKDLSLYQQIAASTSAKVLQNTAQFQQYQELGLQIVASNANTEDIRGMLAGLNPNPAAVEFANYISGSYVRAQQSVLQSIYQINQAYRYAFPGASPDVEISSKDYQGLSTANSELLNKVKAQLTLQGGSSHPVTELPPYVINTTMLGFSDLLKPGGRFTFYISSGDPLFYNLAQFYASKVKVTILGNVTSLDPGNPRLDVNLRHLGTPAVVSTSCQKYTFTHNSRDSTYSYNVQNPSQVYSDGYLGGCGSGQNNLVCARRNCNSVLQFRHEGHFLSCYAGAPSDGKCSSTDDIYIGLSPFSYWEISLPGTAFDYSQVTGIGLSFSGQSRTPDANACFKSVADSLQQPLSMTYSILRQFEVDPPADTVLQAQSGSGSSHAQPLRQCMELSHTNISVTLDFGFLLGSFTNDLLMDDGNLRFPLEDLQASLSVVAKPILPHISGQVPASNTGLISSELGSALFEVDGLNAYIATFTVTRDKLLATALLNPSFTGLYEIIVSAVSTDSEVNDWLSQLESVSFESLVCNPLAKSTKVP